MVLALVRGSDTDRSEVNLHLYGMVRSLGFMRVLSVQRRIDKGNTVDADEKLPLVQNGPAPQRAGMTGCY